MALPVEARRLLAQAVGIRVDPDHTGVAQAPTGSAAAWAWQTARGLEVGAVGTTALAAWPHEPVTVDTAFDLASLTKPIATVTLLAQDVSAGRFGLHSRLDDLLPAARGTPRGAATIGQLLSHVSGAPAWLDFYQQTAGVPAASRPAAVQRAVLGTADAYPRGTQAVYSDLGYMSLGWALEAVHDEPLDQLFARRIAPRLGLTAHFRRPSAGLASHDVVATEVWPPRCADGQPLRGVVHDDNCAALDGVAGHAGLFGSVTDVARWAAAWLACVADGDGDRLGVNPGVARQWTQTPGCTGTSWRHGWDTPSRPGSSAGDRVPDGAFGHLGFTGTSVWLAPAQGACAVLLTNRVHPSRAATDGIRQLRPRLHDLLWQTLSPSR